METDLVRLNGVGVDICLVWSADSGAHKAAVLAAMGALSADRMADDEEFEGYSVLEDKMTAVEIPVSELLFCPEGPLRKTVGNVTTFIDEGLVAAHSGENLSYWYAVTCPVHSIRFDAKRFTSINSELFSRGTEKLVVYKWSTYWSDYFDDGHEWWGAGCWSVYDPEMKRFVVILASETD